MRSPPTVADLYQPITPHEKYNVFVALAAYPHPHALPQLAHLMAHDADWGTRQGAVWLVGQWQLPGAIPHLRAVITRPDEDEQVRYMAALALTLIPTAGAAQTLHELTENPLDAVQRVAQSAKHAVWYTDC